MRPSLDDVQRLSRGDSTKRRGVGSRRVPHRLNADERDIFETAIRNGYAIVDGTAHRRHKEAKGSPLLNILRQRADALARPLVWVEKQPKAADPIYIPEHIPEWENLSGQSIF